MTEALRVRLGSVGIWTRRLRSRDRGVVSECAAAIEQLGFGAMWMPSLGGDTLGDVETCLTSTNRTMVATGILSIWTQGPAELAEAMAGIRSRHPDRFLLGLGASHESVVASQGESYGQPFARTQDYLDELAAAEPPVDGSEIVLAALGPRMLGLAAQRAAGAHPYLVDVEHTRHSRRILGDGPVLAPELKVVLRTDALAARTLAREHLAPYLRLPNYTTNLSRLGYTAQDFASGGSDRLIDNVVAWGSTEQVADRIRQHQQAGADHVCLQVLDDSDPARLIAQWQTLAQAVL